MEYFNPKVKKGIESKSKTISRRGFVLGIAKVAFFGIITSRLAYLQLFKFKEFKQLSDRNRYREIKEVPERGVIYDFKNRIINIFILNGFDLVKTPLLEFNKENKLNSFIIESKKNEPKLFVRDDITPQIIRIASSRFKNKTRPIKLCYYGEVVRKKGSMLRPERQFLQVGSEIIGTDSILAVIEIINLAYISLREIGIKHITLELTSTIFLEKIFSKIKNSISLGKLKSFIKQKDIKNSLNLIKDKKDKLLLNLLSKQVCV